MNLGMCSYSPAPLVLPIPRCDLCSSPAGIEKRKSANQKPEQSHESHVTSILIFLISVMSFFQRIVLIVYYFFTKKEMSDQWDRYKRILDREDAECRKAM